jgi:Domain of unknown function (DUF4252)
MTRELTRVTVVLAIMMAVGAACRARVPQASLQTVAAAEPQVKDELFAGTEKFERGATDVTNVNLDPSMLGLIGGDKSGVAQKMKFTVVHSYRYPKPGMYKMEDVEVYRQKLRTGNWNCFIHITESKTGKSTDICTQPAPNNQGNDMVIMNVEPMELTFIHIRGNASLADLEKLGALNGINAPNKNAQPPSSPPAPPK